MARPRLDQVQSMAVLTGAGISAESGVPTFRGADGLWRHYRAEDLATPSAFRRDPKLVWEWYAWRRSLIHGCQPNAAHHTLVEMEAQVRDFTLITQNVDGLHRLAGSQNVLELHGNIWRVRCTAGCGERELREPQMDELPPLCSCGAPLRPAVVWFGESLPLDVLEAAAAAADRCQVMLTIGTSALVQPAASLPLWAQRAGAYVVEVNPQPTPLSDLVDERLREPAARALPRLWQAWQAT
jgi:NAD-dependent deacetylase